MQQNFNDEILNKIKYSVGSAEIIVRMPEVKSLQPFDDKILNFLDLVSKTLMSNKESRMYPDVITFAFWIRKASMLALKEKYFDEEYIHLGRGVAFHIAPSNVPVNYAYSLVTGLITGNANVVRIPSKDFPQVIIINGALNSALEMYEGIRDYIALVQYGRDKDINDYLSAIADTRIIWGGDATIYEIRKSSLPPRGTEVAFADRFSLSIIDCDEYLKLKNKEKFAEDFYNDTYLTDQNACTSPRLIVWVGEDKNTAKECFWNSVYDLVSKKYTFQSIQGVNKLTSSFMAAATQEKVQVIPHQDNLLVRVKLSNVTTDLIKLKDNSGFFFEYDCDNILDLKELCFDKHIQTIGLLGKKEIVIPLIESGVKGIDRIVPIGKTMDFDLIWDGYNLFDSLTRTVSILV